MYPDDPRCASIVEQIRNEEIKGYAIKHDEDGKEHYHVIVKIDNGQTISAFRKKFGEIGHLWQVAEDTEALAAYYEHDDTKSEEAGKAKYKLSDGFGSLKDKMVLIRQKMKVRQRRISTAQESATMADVLVFLDGHDDYITVRQMVELAITGGWYDVLRRNWSIISMLCKEHNAQYDRQTVFNETLSRDITERIMETWTNALGVKEQFAEVNPKIWEAAIAERVKYETSVKLLNEQVKESLNIKQ